MLIEGMGHDIPHGGGWPKIVEAVAVHTEKAAARFTAGDGTPHPETH